MPNDLQLTQNVGMDDLWTKWDDAHRLREFEQLCVWTRTEYDPPLSTQELVAALRTCKYRSKAAYQYLRANRRNPHLMTTPALLCTATTTTNPTNPTTAVARQSSMGTPEREKRRMSASWASNTDEVPSKRHKDERFALLIDLEDVSEEEDGHERSTAASEKSLQNEANVQLSASAKCAKAQRQLLQVVADCVAARAAVFAPEWVEDVWKSLEVVALPEMATCLEETVDALVTWVQDVDVQDDARDIQERGAALIVEVAASLPSQSMDTLETTECSPTDTALVAKEKEVAAIVQAENDVTAPSAYARAKAAKHAIECLSSSCKVYTDWLSQHAASDEVRGNEKFRVEAGLEALGQRLATFVTERMAEVETAERAVLEAKETKEARSVQIVEFVHKQHQELVAAGETEASASLQAVVNVWKQKDTEVQTLWSSRNESEQLAEDASRTLLVAQHALAFHEKLSVFFCQVRERREEALSSSFKSSEEARTSSEARVTTALEEIIPMLTRALCRYCEFHAVQQSKARGEVEEQEKALAAHNEYFGDSAPIKKGDIEQRIREFIGVTQSSMQVLMEIAEGQQEIWRNKQAVLSTSVRSVLMREFKAFWERLSGPIQDVMKKCVMTIEEVAVGDAAVEPHRVSHVQPASPRFATPDVSNEKMIPAFTVPAFRTSHAETVTPYQRAISAIVAPAETAGSLTVQALDKKRDSTSTSNIRTLADCTMTTSDSGVVATSAPQGSEARRVGQKHAVGSVLYSKVTVGEDGAQFFRGIVLKQLDNDMYEMQYDNGEKFTVKSSYLYTKDPMDQRPTALAHDAEMEDVEHNAGTGGCVVM